AVAAELVFREDRASVLFPAEDRAGLEHRAGDNRGSHPGPDDRAARGADDVLDDGRGAHRGHDRPTAALDRGPGEQREALVSDDEGGLIIDERRAVRVPVVRDADVRMHFADDSDQIPEMVWGGLREASGERPVWLRIQGEDAAAE